MYANFADKRVKCHQCSRTYTKNKGNKKHAPYCSMECVRMATGKTKACLICSQQFGYRHDTQLYCGAKCLKVANAPKMREYYQEKKIESDFLIFKRDDFKCVYCGVSAHDGNQLHIDHIYPRSKGGGNDVFNLVSSCSKCNLEKASSPLSEQKTLALWRRNKQLDIKYGIITSYERLAEIFTRKYPQ